MTQLYARVHVSILDSSIAEDWFVRHVFEDFLKLCNFRNGTVDMTRQAISRRLNIPLDKLNPAIDRLEAPDPHSRDPESEGRRLERMDPHRDWGWRIVNFSKYETVRDRAGDADRAARYRARLKAREDEDPEQPAPPDPIKLPKYHPDSEAVLEHLNAASGRVFRKTEPNLTFISARLNEPDVTLDGVKRMIDRQCEMWVGTTMAEFLRPSTLFNRTKFDGYYAAKDEPVITNDNKGRPQMSQLDRIMQGIK